MDLQSEYNVHLKVQMDYSYRPTPPCAVHWNTKMKKIAVE